MRLIGALSLPRNKFLELKSQAMDRLITGLFEVTKTTGIPEVIGVIKEFLAGEAIQLDNDDSIIGWIQNNPGEIIGALLWSDGKGKFDFQITAGTQAELRMIGEQHG